jgi:tape measure domain-containing protein
MSDFKLAYIYEAIDKFSPVISKINKQVNSLNTKIVKSSVAASKSVDNMTKNIKKSHSMGEKWRAGFKGYIEHAELIKKNAEATKKLTAETKKFYDTSHVAASQAAANAWREEVRRKRAIAAYERHKERMANRPTEEISPISTRQIRGQYRYGNPHLGSLSIAGGSLMASVTAPVAGLGYLAVKNASQFEQQFIRMETMLGGKQAAEKMKKDAQEFSVKNSTKLSELYASIPILSASGVPADKILPKLEILNPLAKFGGFTGLAEISHILTKTINLNSLQADELEQFTNRGIPLLDELAKTFNTTKAQIRKDMEKGLVTGDAVFYVLEKMSKEKYAGFIDKYTKTFAGSMELLQNSITNTLATTGDEIIKVTNLGDKVKSLASFIDKTGNGLVKFAQKNPDLAGSLTLGAGGMALLGPAIKYVGELGLGIWGLTKGMASLVSILKFFIATPLGLIITGIAGTFYYLYQNSELFRKSIQEIVALLPSLEAWRTEEQAKQLAQQTGKPQSYGLRSWVDKLGQNAQEYIEQKKINPEYSSQQMKADLNISIRDPGNLVEKADVTENNSISGFKINIGKNMTSMPGGTY